MTDTTPSPTARTDASPGPALSDQGAPASPAQPATDPPAEHGFGHLLRRFFGVIAQRGTWLNVIYLLLAFPFGLLYFLFVVTGTAIGLGLAILWVGIPILLIVMGAWWAFAALERQLASLLLGVDCGMNPRPWESESGALSRLRAHLVHPSTWRSLVFVLLKFPLGVASFALTVGVAAVVQVLLFAPLWAMSASTEGSDRIVLWSIDTPLEALPLVPLGLLALFVGLHLLNGIAALWRLLVEALLVEPVGERDGYDGWSPQPLPPGYPPPPPPPFLLAHPPRPLGDVQAAPPAAPSAAQTPPAPQGEAPATAPPQGQTPATAPPQGETPAASDPPANPTAYYADAPGAASTSGATAAPAVPAPAPASPNEEAPR
jgi:hypothetical protein